MQIIDGLKIASDIKNELKEEIKTLKKQPFLGVILTGNNPASEVYVAKKIQACAEVGIKSQVYRTHETDRNSEITSLIYNLSESYGGNPDGLLVQLPLPPHIDRDYVFSTISPFKDVDVFHPENVGLLVQGRPRFLPCTPHGIQQMIVRSGLTMTGKHVVVINRSDIVGKPLSSMLIQDTELYANATVTVCHDRTPPERLKKICQQADIVVVAVGIPNFFTADMTHDQQIVIDVGITRVGKKIVGDVHPEAFAKAGWVSPVPGGVGPMTVAMLLYNTVKAARRLNRE